MLMTKLDNEEIRKLLEQIRPKDTEAIKPVPHCMEGTREELLSDVDRYLDDFEKPNILLIHGHPGAGKSTIASTIAFRLRNRRRPVSYFIFERAKAGVTTPSALWCRVGYDLARRYRSAQQSTVEQIKAEEVCLDPPNSEDLFRRLIEEPLKKFMDIPPECQHVVIIDGLDECGGLAGRRSEDRKAMLRILERWSQVSAKFKLIITSRPEEDIMVALSPISYSISLPSGSAVTPETSKDISTFFIRRFCEIA